MAFTTWSAELTRFRDALAGMEVDTLLKSGWTTGDGENHTFRSLDEITRFEKFLEEKAEEESNPGGRRSSIFSFGYKSRG